MSIVTSAILIGFSALVSSIGVWWAMRHAASRGILDHPGVRQSHDAATLTGCGIGMIAAVVVVSLLVAVFADLPEPWVPLVLPGMAILSLVGWLDDRHSLSSVLRLLVQLAVSFSLLGWLATGQWQPVLLVAAGISMVWLLNAYNFMDGSNGMAGFQGVFVGATVVALAFSSADFPLAAAALIVIGACVGFLPFNVPRARVFMGDAGSVPLGFALAALWAIGIGTGSLGFAEALLAFSVFLTDTSLTLLKRVIQGEQWYTAHKQHIYQRLIVHGWSHSRVLLMYQAINLIMVAPALTLARMYPELAWSMAGMMYLLLSVGWYSASLRLGVRN